MRLKEIKIYKGCFWEIVLERVKVIFKIYGFIGIVVLFGVGINIGVIFFFFLKGLKEVFNGIGNGF